jgi:hypothetical protein
MIETRRWHGCVEGRSSEACYEEQMTQSLHRCLHRPYCPCAVPRSSFQYASNRYT